MKCPLEGMVAGLDEAGRAPLAGPVISSCVVWRGFPGTKEKVNDSKLLSAAERERMFSWIIDNAYRVGVGAASPEEIERLNIHKASLLSMERAVRNTGLAPDVLLVDGLFGLKSYPHSAPLVKGDRKCFFIASASIIAKVVRDRIMDFYEARYPGYAFKKHKGYPTPEHRRAIEEHGLTPIHRRTFKGVREHAFFG